MKIHEISTPEGLEPVWLRADAGGLAIVVRDVVYGLPDGALAAVMNRYGGELEPSEDLHEIDALELGDQRLRHVRHLARYDVIAKDFLVYERASGSGPALCALGATVAASLQHLARVPV